MTTRILPSGSFASKQMAVNKTFYTLVRGQTQDIADADAAAIASTGNATAIATVGTTAQRPAAAIAVLPHVDTTISQTIFSDGVVWRSVTGAAV